MKSLSECAYTENMRLILETVYRKEIVTRKALTEITGLSSLTIAKIIKTLLDDGAIMETTPAESEKGRKPLLLAANPDYAYVVGIDIGSYSVKIGAVDFRGGIMEQEITSYDEEQFPVKVMDFEELKRRIAGLIARYGESRLLGIGLGISGLVDYDAQTIVFCPNMQGYNNLPVSRLLAEEFGVPVIVDTSARCMALGEKYFGKNGFEGDLSFVSIGHSIAAGTIIGNHTFRGTSGFAGELGHVKSIQSELVCTCGSRGCIELYATLPLIHDRIIAQLDSYRGYSLLKETYVRAGVLTHADISDAVVAGDKVAIEEMERVISVFCDVLSDYVNLFNPKLLVLGGGFMDLYPFAIYSMADELKKKCLTPSQQNLRLCSSELSVEGAIIGSAMQLIQTRFF